MNEQQLIQPQQQRRAKPKRPTGLIIRITIVVVAALIFVVTAIVLTIANVGLMVPIMTSVGVALGIVVALAQWLLPVPSSPDAALSPSVPLTPVSSPTPTPAPPVVTVDPQLWSVPYPRNTLFTGRVALLEHLHKRLTSGARTAALTQTQAISGLGGIGKTQAALEYAYRNRAEYSVVVWLRAETRDTLIADLTAVARQLALPGLDERDPVRSVELFKRWCATHAGWLLIYDNADEPALVAPWLPTGGTGHIILTTRAQALGTLAEALDVESMDAAEGTELLLRRAKILARNQPPSAASPTQRAQAEAIVAALGGLPLALDQAAAYLDETGCPLASYLDLYQQQRKLLLERGSTLPGTYRGTVATTWSLAFRIIEKKHPDAAALLSLCAFLAPNDIPEAMFRPRRVSLGQPLNSTVADPARFNAALEVVRRYSLLRRNREQEALSIHRLVQVILQESMPATERRVWAERAVRLVSKAVPKVDLGALSLFQRYLAQAEQCAQLIEQYQMEFVGAAYLLHDEGLYLYYTAQYARPEPLYLRALAIKRKILGEEHPDTAATQNELATLYQGQGRNKEAEQLYRRALNSNLNALGEEHPDTVATQHNLAWLYQKQGRYKEAEQLYLQALRSSVKTLGEEHPDTATTQHKLATLYQEQHRYSEAEQLYQQALSSSIKKLREEHPDTATTQHKLATLYQEQHRYSEAEQLYQQALHVYEKEFSESHPETLTVLENYANLLRKLHRDEEAAVLEERVQTGWAKRRVM